jgi:hypothetical protein
MNTEGFFELAKQPFEFGPKKSSLETILGRKTLENIHKKFKEEPLKLVTALRETVRFLYLAAHSPRTLFFPGDKLMDDLWHALVVETMDYQGLCGRLRPGSFVHHSGVPFSEYASQRSDEEVHEEQCSWLASYISNFGPIEKGSAVHLNLVQSLANRINGDLDSVNRLGMELIELSRSAKANSKSPFNFQDFLGDVQVHANQIDKDPKVLGQFLGMLAEGLKSGAFSFDNSHLERLFGASTALAFTFWQHLAVSERLSGLPEWKARNPGLWEEISNYRLLCGLATTHLANPAGAGIKGKACDTGFLLTGQASWVCGFGIFDLLLVGFDCGDSIAFAITGFPDSAIPQEMSCLTGSSTVRVKFENFLIKSSAIVSQRQKNQTPPAPRTTGYVIPELGIAKACVERLVKLVAESKHPKHTLIAQNLPQLQGRILRVESLRAENAALDVLIPLRDEINRDAVRLLSLALGASSILPESNIPRLQCELLLLDAVLHSPASLETKIASICKGPNV